MQGNVSVSYVGDLETSAKLQHLNSWSLLSMTIETTKYTVTTYYIERPFALLNLGGNIKGMFCNDTEAITVAA